MTFASIALIWLSGWYARVALIHIQKGFAGWAAFATAIAAFNLWFAFYP